MLDLGVGNIGSVVNMLRFVGASTRVVTSAEDLGHPRKLVFPGVGHWDHASGQLDSTGMRDALSSVMSSGRTDVLGICLGMQLLLEKSEEGVLPGLGWIPGRVAKFAFETADGPRPRVPHMGWNVVADTQHTAMSSPPGETRFYFAHSYHAVDVDADHVVMTARHGYDFPCGVRRGRVWGVQFHPEKSHRFGVGLMSRFMRL